MGIDHNPNANLWGGSQQTGGAPTTFGAFSVNFGDGGVASSAQPTTNNAGMGGGPAAPAAQQDWMLLALVAAVAWTLAKHK
jgi:hypothetical protein